MKCPVDGTPMIQRIYEDDVEVDECPTCLGIWLDRGELFRIERSQENDYSEILKTNIQMQPPMEIIEIKTRKTSLQCPSCGDVLYEKEHGFFSKIMIDVCIGCGGIWLDKGELQALEIFFEKNKPAEEMTFWQSFRSGLKQIFDS